MTRHPSLPYIVGMESPVPQDIVHPSPEPDPAPVPSSACHVDGENGTSDGAADGCAESPVLVIRGERGSIVPGVRADLALVDWLAFTVRPEKADDWKWMRNTLHYVFKIPAYTWHETGRQWHGYTTSAELVDSVDGGESIRLGVVAWGGESQRGTLHVELFGRTCARLADWEGIKAWGESAGAVLTRVDVAHDDFEGTTVNIEQARTWLKEGGFASNGRPPRARLIDDLESGEGKTFYVGNRAYGKLCRVYEKGKQLGDPTSPWNRIEVEVRNKGRIIPWHVLTSPGHFLAGAYPCLYFLSVRQERIKTIHRSVRIQYPRMVENVKRFAGRSLNAMYEVEGGDAEAVLKQVLRAGRPKSLEPVESLRSIIEEICRAYPES